MVDICESFDALDQNSSVPGAIQDDHSAPPRQNRPEPPKEVVPLLVPRGRRVLRDADMSRIQRFDEPPDRSALARRVPSLEDHTERRPELVAAEVAAKRQSVPEHPLLRSRQPFERLLLRRAFGRIDVG